MDGKLALNLLSESDELALIFTIIWEMDKLGYISIKGQNILLRVNYKNTASGTELWEDKLN